MKKIFSIYSLICVLCLSFFSCGNKEEQKDNSAQIAGIIAKSDSMLPNYRFVDIDTVFQYYNLAKDYTEEMLRLQANYESQVKKHQNSLQAKATEIDKKRQNNGYLSEASLNYDLQELNTRQESAQRSIASLQNNMLIAEQQGRQTVVDSILSYINEYNAKKGYDAIFMKGSTLYSNPALDITPEIIKGLNEKYNKVK